MRAHTYDEDDALSWIEGLHRVLFHAMYYSSSEVAVEYCICKCVMEEDSSY